MESGDTTLGKADKGGMSAHDDNATSALRNEFVQNAKFGQPPIGDSNKVYMCGNGNIGQNLSKDDFDSLKKDLKTTMDEWAEKVSKANGGASIEVGGNLRSVYESTFCNGISILPAVSTAGRGETVGTVKMPDNAEVTKELHDLALKFSDKLDGPRFAYKQQDIIAELGVSAHNEATNKRYTDTIIINPGRN